MKSSMVVSLALLLTTVSLTTVAQEATPPVPPVPPAAATPPALPLVPALIQQGTEGVSKAAQGAEKVIGVAKEVAGGVAAGTADKAGAAWDATKTGSQEGWDATKGAAGKALGWVGDKAKQGEAALMGSSTGSATATTTVTSSETAPPAPLTPSAQP